MQCYMHLGFQILLTMTLVLQSQKYSSFFSDSLHPHLWPMKAQAVQIMTDRVLSKVFVVSVLCLGPISSHWLDDIQAGRQTIVTQQDCTGSWDAQGELVQHQVRSRGCPVEKAVINSRPIRVGFNCQRHNLQTGQGILMRDCLGQAGLWAFLEH